MDDILQKKRGGALSSPRLSHGFQTNSPDPLSIRVVLWGIGNPLGGDDGVGVHLAEVLGAHPPVGMNVVSCETVPENYLAPLQRHLPELLLVVDAADMGLPPGSCRRMEAQDLISVSWGTHGSSLPHLLAPLDLAVIFIGIQPLVRTLGTELSPPVAAAAHRLATILRCGNWDHIPSLYKEKRSPK